MPEFAKDLPAGEEVLTTIPLDRVVRQPHEPRQIYDDAEMAELTHSIHTNGVQEPIVVYEVEGDEPGRPLYLRVSGSRRCAAAQGAGLTEIPARVRKWQPSEEELQRFGILANSKRADLRPAEQGDAFKRYLDTVRISAKECAARFGMTPMEVSRKLKLTKLIDPLKALVNARSISEDAGRFIADRELDEQEAVLALIEGGLTGASLTKFLKNGKIHAPDSKESDGADASQTKVSLRVSGETFVISCISGDPAGDATRLKADLQAIVRVIQQHPGSSIAQLGDYFAAKKQAEAARRKSEAADALADQALACGSVSEE